MRTIGQKVKAIRNKYELSQIDFAQVTDEELAHAIHLINDRPRKCLGWKSAHESFMEQVCRT